MQDNNPETVMLYTTVVHALPTLLERVGIKRPLRVSNLLFSNPFGLATRCYLMGAEVELALPMSVVAAGQMLNITVVTLADHLQVGLLGIPGAIEHIDQLAAHRRGRTRNSSRSWSSTHKLRRHRSAWPSANGQRVDAPPPDAVRRRSWGNAVLLRWVKLTRRHRPSMTWVS
ncbi:MAG: DUF1298 domain-containing protein [Ideonella sp.]|nr:DUF1298 domain-containing protein [Ideonella sp.]